MQTPWMTAAALVLMTLAGYAQYRIPFHTAGRARAALTRGVLAALGIALGIVTALEYPGDTARAVSGFMIGFGLVHVPAALILFLKRRRGEGKS